MDCELWMLKIKHTHALLQAVIAALLLFAAPVQAQKALLLPEIEYASPDQSVWTTRVKEGGEPDNPLLRVAGALFAKAGIPWHGKSYPASRLFAYLQDGTAQFSMLVRVPALQDCCLFSKKPVTTAEIRAYRRTGTAPIKVREDLAGKSVITIRGYSYGGLVNFLADERNRVTNHVTQAHASAFRMLESGRADYVIDYAGPANEVLAAEPIAGMSFDVLTRQEVYLVLSRTYPDAQGVMDRLEAIVATLDVEGLIANEMAGAKKDVSHKAVLPLGRPASAR
jgi:ABC-type amino acid transport substrate-binding protein